MSPLRAAVSILMLTFALAAHAAAPMAKTAPPGYFRFMLGDFEVTALSDGTADLPVDKLLTGTSKENIDKALAKAFLSSPLQTLGNLMKSLEASGYQPDQVDEIYITHMHPDHVGGLSTDGKMNFPNALVRADKRDADYWLSPETLAKADEGSKGFVQGAQAMLGPYVQAGKFKPFEGDTELVPGVRAHAAYGHTPGHTIYVVESNGQKLVLWGDLMHVAALQFPDPSITIKFDSDSKAAMAQRKKAFADAAKNGFWVGAAHLPFPGLGHLKSAGKGYTFIPVNYSVIRTAQ